MNPASTWIYYRRHKKRALLLGGLVGLVTLGLSLAVALAWAITIEPTRSNRLFLTHLSVVMPSLRDSEAAAAVVGQIRAHPDVEQVIPTIFSLSINLPDMMGAGTSGFNLLGLREADLATVLQRCGATLQEGQLPRPRSNGILFSEQVATALGVELGDTIEDSVNPDLYRSLFDPLEVVGILDSDVRLAIVSQEFLASHEVYGTFPLRFLVVPHAGREAAVDHFLRTEIEGPRTGVLTLHTLNQEMAREYRATVPIVLVIVTAIAVAIALVVAAANRLAFAQRLPEFGILHAMGHSRRWLARRLTAEAAVLAVAGWVAGMAVSWLALWILRLALFAPRGHDLRVLTLAPALLVAPVPLLAIGSTLVYARRLFSQLDAVAVVERGALSLEAQSKHRPQADSSPQPLASRTFFARHKGRALLLTCAMGLMIVAVALLVFVFTATDDAQKARLGDLEHMCQVAPSLGVPLDPGLAAQIRAHQAVERVIPTHQQTMLNVSIPPFGSVNVHPYAVYADDLAYLVARYGLHLKEGHLPRPYTNEIVIPETVAANRDIQVGDVIGRRDRPAYPGAFELPAELVISGIFARAGSPAAENWLTFLSLEYVESHESFNPRGALASQLLVVAKPGQKDNLEAWLVDNLDRAQAAVITQRSARAAALLELRSTLLTMALIEGLIAVVAALALAVLNTIFASERQAEFGVLHALGRTRLWLVWRSVRETAFTTGAAWILSALFCLAGLLALQFAVFAPLGLRLDPSNLTPWLFTLPVPVAVLAVSAGTLARILARLDPVSIIERR
jgi:putative ABC transport system permease protein